MPSKRGTLPLSHHPTRPPASPAGPMDVCPQCGRRCRVPVTRAMPRPVQEAYEKARRDFMCTCDGGAAEEARLLGASYADVITERLGRVGAANQAAHARSAAHTPADGELHKR